jgi:bifunctional non-homologous end joining protein LigD
MAARTSGAKAPYPGFIESALTTSIDKAPSGERWLHEIKFDGYRVQVHIKHAAITVFTRRGNDWTKRFKKIADDAWHINAGPRSSMARWWFRRQTARPISRYCRTS